MGDVIRVFPRRTTWTPVDSMAFVGDPQLLLPEANEVKISVTFTWDIPEGKRLHRAWAAHYSNVTIGGPAFNDHGETFTPGEFIKKGVVFTSRGCIRNCGFCMVRQREGGIRELPITDGYIVQDNNLLACSDEHIDAVLAMLRRQKHPAEFKGGLDARLFKQWHRDLLDTIRVKELWFACDAENGLKLLARVARLLEGVPINKRRCYMLFGYNGDTPQKAHERASKVLSLGFLPFAQLYIPSTGKKPLYSTEFCRVARYWARPAIYRSPKKDLHCG